LEYVTLVDGIIESEKKSKESLKVVRGGSWSA
jgi:hypothetical protein